MKFKSGYNLGHRRDVIIFEGVTDGRAVTFAITRQALTDTFALEDTLESAEKKYIEIEDTIHRIALLAYGESKDEEIVITTVLFQKYSGDV